MDIIIIPSITYYIFIFLCFVQTQQQQTHKKYHKINTEMHEFENLEIWTMKNAAIGRTFDILN